MTEFGGDGGAFDSGSTDSGSFDSGSLDTGSLDTGSDLGSLTTPVSSTGLDAFSDLPTMTMPTDTSSSLGLPDTTTQSFTSFSQPGTLSPGDPGTSTLGTDTFAPTPMTTYPSDFSAPTDPLAAPVTPAATLGTPTTAPVATDGLDWAGAQQSMTMPGTPPDTTDFNARWAGTGASDPSAGFFADIQGMQSGSQSVLGLTQDATGATNTLGGLSLGLPAFAAIGNDVGLMSGQLQTQQTSALTQLMLGMQGIGTSIGTAANGYSTADQAVAQGFGGLGTPSDPSATTPATPAAPTSTDPILNAVGTHHYGDSGADVTAIQSQLNAAGYNVGTADGQWGIATQAALAQYAHDNNLTLPAQPNQLDQRAIDQILNAEGNNRNFTQGGLHEIYGIRQGNPGYAGVNAASQQFGQNSAGERAAASQVVQNAYNSAGFTGFTDPGEQAAIASAIHMRGPGGAGTGVQGTSAILHGMATGTTDAHTAATPADVQTVQQMTPDQFQTAFRSAREAYDQDAYGNTTTNLNGTRQNWWSAYGHGLQNRYDAEERQFRGMSGTP